MEEEKRKKKVVIKGEEKKKKRVVVGIVGVKGSGKKTLLYQTLARFGDLNSFGIRCPSK